MSKREKKKPLFDLFGFDEKGFPSGKEAIGGSGYSISVSYDEADEPVVQVKAYGDVDTATLRKDIERRYPGARIVGLERKPLMHA